MDCEQVNALMMAELDGELQSEDRAPLHAHLAACVACRSTALAFRLQDADLHRAFAPRRQAAAAVANRVIAQLPDASRNVRSRLSWLPMFAAAAAGFLLAVALFRPWEKSPPGMVIDERNSADAQKHETVLLAVASGAVELLAANTNSWQKLQSGAEIALGSRVRTGPGVRCEFRTADGSEIRLNNGTELVFAARRLLELTGGQILASVAEASSPFQVQIPDATVTAAGTEFDLLCKPAESLLTVLQGSTKVEGSGMEARVEKGERAKIIGGRITQKEHVQNLVQATRWVHEILILKGRGNKELAKRVDDLLAQLAFTKTEFLNEEEIRALGDHCVLPLTRFLQSERYRREEEKRRVAANILADLAQPWSIPDLINLLRDSDGEVRYHIARGLERLTKETLGRPPEQWSKEPSEVLDKTYKEWQKWWQKHKHLYPGTPRE